MRRSFVPYSMKVPMAASTTRIRTFLRLRPRRASRSARAEASIRALERDEEEDESTRARVVECARAASERRAGAKDARHVFAFDDVFDEDASQAMVFDAVGRDVVEAALAIASEMAGLGPVALAYAKRAIHDHADGPLEAGLAAERALFGMCFATDDQSEGMRAFLEKRAPAFKGA